MFDFLLEVNLMISRLTFIGWLELSDFSLAGAGDLPCLVIVGFCKRANDLVSP